MTTNDTSELLWYALRGSEAIFVEGYCYKKAGVMLTELVPAQIIQTNLFDRRDRDRSRRLMAVVDQVNQRWGAETLKYAATGLQPQWQMRAECRSPRYTTRWADLPIVKA